MNNFKEICKKIGNSLRHIFGWGICLSLFSGGLTFFFYVAALCIGGETGNAICLFMKAYVWPVIITTANCMVVLGLVIMYLCGEVALTSKKKK